MFSHYELIKNFEFFITKFNEFSKIIKKNLENTNDYIIGKYYIYTGLKFCRLSIQIIEKLSTCLHLIPLLLKYADKQGYCWQKYIGIECISSLCNNNKILMDLFLMSKMTGSENSTVYYELLTCLAKVSYSSVGIKQIDLKKDKKFE